MKKIEEFLNARLAEDEAMAQGAARHFSAIWTFDNGEAAAQREEIARGGRFGANPRVDGITSGCRYNAESEMEHIARHDPARTLREVATKRAIIEAAADATGCDMQVDSEFGVGRRNLDKDPYVGDVILRALASAYADHPDYQPGWAL